MEGFKNGMATTFGGYVILMSYLIQLVSFFAVGVLVAEWLDSTLIGLIVAFVAYGTGALGLLVLPLMLVFVGIPTFIFSKFGWVDA